MIVSPERPATVGGSLRNVPILDTGQRQPHARALYVSAGYVAISDYSGNPYAAYWGEKRL